MDFAIAHDFDSDVDGYWRTFFDEDYNAALYRELGMRERRLIERRDEDGGDTIRRVVRIVPKADIPAVVQKFVGSQIAYVERSVWRRAASALDVEIEIDVPAARDRVQMRGVYTVAPLGTGRVRREFRGTIRVGIPLLGGQIERQVVESIRKSYETAATFTRRWLAEHAQR